MNIEQINVSYYAFTVCFIFLLLQKPTKNYSKRLPKGEEGTMNENTGPASVVEQVSGYDKWVSSFLLRLDSHLDRLLGV